MGADDDIIRELLADSSKVTGMTLEMLGYEPHPDEIPADERAQLEPEDLADMAATSDEDRAETLRQAKLLAGLLWRSSIIMIDQLYADLAEVSAMDEVTAEGIYGTWVLSSLPERFAAGYGVTFVRRFIVVAADLTGTLASGWRPPGCVAAELAVRCLLDQAETTAELYGLDLADGWREWLEQMMLEDPDSEMLYSRRLDGFEDDGEMASELGLAPMKFTQWFEPFNVGYSVPPYAQA